MTRITIDPKACNQCGHFACICQDLADHKLKCKYRRAVTSTVPVECEHGHDVCPICDPCDCDIPSPNEGAD